MNFRKNVVPKIWSAKLTDSQGNEIMCKVYAETTENALLQVNAYAEDEELTFVEMIPLK